MQRTHIGGLVLAALLTASIAPAAHAKPCDFCGCVLGINPYYTSSDMVSLSVLLEHTTEPAGSGPFGAHLKPAAFTSPAGLSGFTGGSGPQLSHTPSLPSTVATDERRTTFELSLQHHFSDHLMITASLPMSTFGVTNERVLTVRGVGDPSLIVHYVATTPAGSALRATVLIGGGLDLPVGAANLMDARGARLDPRLQPGSGSADALASLRAMAQSAAWTFALDMLGRCNTANSHHDRIGNSLSATATANHDLLRSDADGFALIGIAGVRAEMAATDRVGGVRDAASGYTTGYAQFGAQLAYGDLRLNLSILAPAFDHRAASDQRQTPRLAASLGWEF